MKFPGTHNGSLRRGRERWSQRAGGVGQEGERERGLWLQSPHVCLSMCKMVIRPLSKQTCPRPPTKNEAFNLPPRREGEGRQIS